MPRWRATGPSSPRAARAPSPCASCSRTRLACGPMSTWPSPGAAAARRWRASSMKSPSTSPARTCSTATSTLPCSASWCNACPDKACPTTPGSTSSRRWAWPTPAICPARRCARASRPPPGAPVAACGAARCTTPPPSAWTAWPGTRACLARRPTWRASRRCCSTAAWAQTASASCNPTPSPRSPRRRARLSNCPGAAWAGRSMRRWWRSATNCRRWV